MARKTGVPVEKKNVKQNDDSLQMDFLNIISHELKTPLTPMTAYVDLLLKERLGSLTEQQREALEIIEKNAKILKRLIWDVLDLSRLEAGNMKFSMQQIDLTEIVEEVIKNMGTFAKTKGIAIKSQIRPLPLTEGDRERLSQVITNLLDNAIKFTPEKGMITVETRKECYSLIISISDTGIGIPEKQVEKIFTKFFQVDNRVARKYSGTGLGLTICKGIINAHGGNITVESTLKKGSTFNIVLPYKSIGKPTEMFVEAFKKK